MRTPIIAGNWKMHKNMGEAVETCRRLEELVGGSPVEVVICAPFTSLSPLNALGLRKVKLGAQNMYFEEKGAYTGEISGEMLVDAGCLYVILGHSERRSFFHEDDRMINKKVLKALEIGLRPILCVGETSEQRDWGETEKVVGDQTKKALEGVPADKLSEIVIAYEPIWAIGTGKNPSAKDAGAVIRGIRRIVAELYSLERADLVRIQYGGSVKPGNILEFMEQPHIDGALVGGASLNAQDFAGIIDYKRCSG